jgi:uncharacterized OB-fold protein
MPDPVLRSPTLVSIPTGGARPSILVGRCSCGHSFHPPHRYGCERCGRDGNATEIVECEARGVLTAVATVHAHPKLRTPFVLGRITLDRGPSIEAWLDATPGALTIGKRVEGTLVPGGTNDSGAPIMDCRFVAEGTL